MNKLTLDEIMKIVVTESRNGCSDASSAYRHLLNNYGDRIESPRILGLLLESLNYHAIRENSGELYDHFMMK
ncbi:MAG: hypothetical protein ABWX90_02490 [Candidatus Saccharimonadales bacterium]